MSRLSVVICTHKPRHDYLQRVFAGLERQTLPNDRWELLVIDNGEECALADLDLSWHPRSRLVHEGELGLTRARVRGILESTGDLVVFVDDDNVLAVDYLTQVLAIYHGYPFLGAFGAGNLHPEFETQPPLEIRPHLKMLAVRNAPAPRWSNNLADNDSIPWGAGLCVTRRVSEIFSDYIERLAITDVLGRRGDELFSHEDDVFSWVAASIGMGFGVFPQLRATHLIPSRRLTRNYLLKLIRDGAFSQAILQFALTAVSPRRITNETRYRAVVHWVRNGRFGMMRSWASWRGEDAAARFVIQHQLQPLSASDLAASVSRVLALRLEAQSK